MPKRSKFLSPLPVVVAFFAGGEQVRMSFGQPRGEAWQFDRVTKMVCKIIGNERARVGWEPTFANPTPPHPMHTKPADDLLCVFVEWNGEIIRDMPAPARGDVRAAKRAEVARKTDPRRKQVALRVVAGGAKPSASRSDGSKATKRKTAPKGRKATRKAAQRSASRSEAA